MKGNRIRTLFSRNHETIFPKLGVFLGGPTPPSGNMKNGWRNTIINRLQNDSRLDPSMIVVAPEPQSGVWEDIDISEPKNELEVIKNKQMPWELQYLRLCDITAFWFPSYWNKSTAEHFSANIGPTSRFEFGYFLQEYLKNPAKRSFIIGGPEDAENIQWARKISSMNGIKWHTLKKKDKGKLVADSFVEEISNTLINNKWK